MIRMILGLGADATKCNVGVSVFMFKDLVIFLTFDPLPWRVKTGPIFSIFEFEALKLLLVFNSTVPINT